MLDEPAIFQSLLPRLDVIDDDHVVFAYEFSKSVLCHVQRTSDWLVRVDRADGTILFSQPVEARRHFRSCLSNPREGCGAIKLPRDSE